jgi:hypothetical protein
MSPELNRPLEKILWEKLSAKTNTGKKACLLNGRVMKVRTRQPDDEIIALAVGDAIEQLLLDLECQLLKIESLDFRSQSKMN